MKPSSKIAIVAGGYTAAFLIASAAVALRVATTTANAQTSGGMYAFGDAALFVGVFGLTALLPSTLGLFFLRPFVHLWKVFSIAGLTVALTGVAAAFIFALGRKRASFGSSDLGRPFGPQAARRAVPGVCFPRLHRTLPPSPASDDIPRREFNRSWSQYIWRLRLAHSSVVPS